MIKGAFTRSKRSGSSAGVGVASESIEAPFRRSLFQLGAAAIVLALVGVLLAWRLAGRLGCSVASLSRAAEACGSGRVATKAGIREIEQISAALLGAAALPRPGDVAQSAAARIPAPAPDAAPRVLLVDDNEDVLAVMATVLRRAGQHVVEASDGPTAIDFFGDGTAFDAVVLDYAMPGMKGTAAARAIRAIRQDVPILLVTGFGEAMAPGEWPAEYILHKPFRPDRLRQRIEELLALQRNTRGDKT